MFIFRLYTRVCNVNKLVSLDDGLKHFNEDFWDWKKTLLYTYAMCNIGSSFVNFQKQTDCNIEWQHHIPTHSHLWKIYPISLVIEMSVAVPPFSSTSRDCTILWHLGKLHYPFQDGRCINVTKWFLLLDLRYFY